MTQAEYIIEAFGGPAKMARVLGLKSSTVRMWQQPGAIPHKYAKEVYDAANSLGLGLSPSDFLSFDPGPGAAHYERPSWALQPTKERETA